MNWDLGERRGDWTKWIHDQLAAASSTQANAADNIEELEGDGKSKTSAVSRFVKGNPAELRSWFTERPEWLDQLAVEMDVEAGEIHTMFERLRSGESPPAPWHPAFPGVEPFMVQVPSPLSGPMGRNAETVVASWRREVNRSKGKPGSLTVIGPAGRSRDVVVKQLSSALHDLVPTATVAVGSGAGDDDAWRITARDEGERDAPFSVHWCRLAPWTMSNVSRLARKLADCPFVPQAHRSSLKTFAKFLASLGSEGHLLTPDLAISLCAEVARSNPPTSLAQVDALLSAGAWRRAKLGRPRLEAFGESLAEAFFSGVARREKAPDEVGGVLWLPENWAVPLLVRAVRDVGGFTAATTILSLTEELVAAQKGKDRDDIAKRLRSAAAGDPPMVLLHELIAGGILARQGVGDRTLVGPAHPLLGSIWAARGLAGKLAIHGCWERLCDPTFADLVGEQARGGLSLRELMADLAGAPPELAVDAAVLVVRYAVSTPDVLKDPRIVQAWAAVLWAAAHGYLYSRPEIGVWGWGVAAREQLLLFTRRYRDSLPRMGDDPVATVLPLVPDDVVELVAGWRRIESVDGEAEAVGRQEFTLISEFQSLVSRQKLVYNFRQLAPELFVADSPLRWGWWQWTNAEFGRKLVVHEAERGNDGCVELLSGRAWAKCEEGPDQQSAFEFWSGTSWETKVEWGVRGEMTGAEGLLILHQLCRGPNAQPDDPKLVDFAVRLGVATMEPECQRALTDRLGRWHMSMQFALPANFALAVAERLGMAELLEAACLLPFAWAESVRLRIFDGFIFINEEGIDKLDSERPRLSVNNRLSELDELAERAAVALHRMGHPHALHRRWLDAGPEVNEQCIKVMNRINGLFQLASNDPRFWKHQGMELSMLSGFPTPPGDLKYAWQMLCQYLPKAQAWRGVSQLGREYVSPELLAALDGLRGLLFSLPDDLPQALDDALCRLAKSEQMVVFNADEAPRFTERRIAAVRLLLEAGDESPLHAWAEGLHLGSDASPAAAAVAWVLRDWKKTNSQLIVRAWHLFPAEPGGRWGSEDWTNGRDLLLSSGATNERQGDDRADRPLPFVVEYAAKQASSEELEWMNYANSTRPQWLAVIRRRRSLTQNPRTVAYWSMLANRLRADPDEWAGCLRYWLHDDPTPWSGGRDWRRDGDQWVGGCEDLLAGAVADTSEWATTGIVRLFQLALLLPLRKGFTGLGYRPATVELSDMSGEAQWPIGALANALVDRRRGDVIADAWRAVYSRDPAEGPAETSEERLQRWLLPWWVREAPSDELFTIVQARSMYWPRAADELLNRGDPRLAAAAEDIAATMVRPEWNLLAATAPDRLQSALAERLGTDQPWRISVSGMTGAADEAQHHPSLLAARTVAFKRGRRSEGK